MRSVSALDAVPGSISGTPRARAVALNAVITNAKPHRVRAERPMLTANRIALLMVPPSVSMPKRVIPG